MNPFWLKLKKFFGAELTPEEKLALVETPVLVAIPKPSTVGAAESGLVTPPSNSSAVKGNVPENSPGISPAPRPSAPAPTPAPMQTPTPIPPAFSRFDKAVRYVMENEDGVRWDHDDGEFTNNPKDPGGATMWGVIKTEYEDYLGRKLSIDEVKRMPRSIAVSIYAKKFWLPIDGNSYLSDVKTMAIMDTAVNKGLGGCMVVLTDALHDHFETRYGRAVHAAVDAMGDQEFLNAMADATIRYIERRIKDYPKMEWARKGWTNRANRMRKLLVWSAA